MNKKIIVLLLLFAFLLPLDCLTKNYSYCTPEVKEKGLLTESALQCKLVQLTLDYIALNLVLEVDKIVTSGKQYKSYYITITIFKPRKEEKWDVGYYTLIILFDKNFNIIKTKK